MIKLPHVSSREICKCLKRTGFVVVRQRGDHLRLEKNTLDKTIKLTVPLHREVKLKTLATIIKQSGLTKKEFLKLR